MLNGVNQKDLSQKAPNPLDFPSSPFIKSFFLTYESYPCMPLFTLQP